MEKISPKFWVTAVKTRKFGHPELCSKLRAEFFSDTNRIEISQEAIITDATRVARWNIFKQKFPHWVNLAGPCNGRCWYILSFVLF
jgi:hypothetical protein